MQRLTTFALIIILCLGFLDIETTLARHSLVSEELKGTSLARSNQMKNSKEDRSPSATRAAKVSKMP